MASKCFVRDRIDRAAETALEIALGIGAVTELGIVQVIVAATARPRAIGRVAIVAIAQPRRIAPRRAPRAAVIARRPPIAPATPRGVAAVAARP